MALISLDTSTDPQVGYRPSGTLDAESALAPYAGHFGVRQAAHLLRRAGFGGSAADVARTAGLGASAAVDSFVHPAAPELPFEAYPPREVLYAVKGGQARTGTELWWLDRMLRTQHPLAEKMTLFWHGHFATSIAKVPPALMARQIDLFRAQGLGNFHALLAAVSVDPAMSVWLDNRSNSKAHPNENYAREVMELFALGLGEYTESDVKEAARAFTGWAYDSHTMSVSFDPRRHDDGVKTFLGHSGNFGLTDVVNIIVAQPVHQRFLARKLLEYFVYSDPEPALTEAVAQTYALCGCDIAITGGTILRSNVFYSARAYRALPKSPIEFAVGLLRYVGATSVPPGLPDALRRQQHRLPVMPGAEFGPHIQKNLAVEAIREHRFQTVSHLQPAPVIIRDQQQLNAVVLPLLSHAELPKKVDADILERIPIKRLQRDEGHLGTGRLFDGGGVVLDGGAALGVDHAGEITDVSLRFQRFEIQRGQGRREKRQPEQRYSQQMNPHKTMRLSSLRRAVFCGSQSFFEPKPQYSRYVNR